MGQAGNITCMGEEGNSYNILVRIDERTRPCETHGIYNGFNWRAVFITLMNFRL
jgi:hypothetical protein